MAHPVLCNVPSLGRNDLPRFLCCSRYPAAQQWLKVTAMSGHQLSKSDLPGFNLVISTVFGALQAAQM